MKTYRKTATVEAKIFEPGDEVGIRSIKTKDGLEETPYISTLENQHHYGEFYKNYICTGINGERWLVEKSIFEQTYEEI